MPTEEDFTYDNIMNLEYLDQVWNGKFVVSCEGNQIKINFTLFSEILRMHGPASHLSRMCSETVEIDLPKDKKLLIEEGTILLFPIRSMHMDPEFYPNPEKFDPDRFSPENGGVKALIDQGVFIPFGNGPRICVGNRFAFTQAKIAIAALVKNFDISLNPKSPKEYVIHPQALLYTLIGCYVDFKEI